MKAKLKFFDSARWFTAIVVVAAGCASTPPETFEMPVAVEVRDGLDRGIAGATIALDGRPAGHSGASGQLLILARGREGDVRRLTLDCPPGYEEDGAEQDVVLRRLSGPSGGISLAPQSLLLRCIESTRKVVLLVRTVPPLSAPILAWGQQIGQTDPDGVAQVLLEGKTNEEVEVSLDTSVQPRWRPARPTRRFTFAERPQLLVFDQVFAVPTIQGRKGPKLPKRL